MENQKPNLLKNAMNYGAITGLILVVFSLILYFTGLFLSKPMGYVTIVLLAACLFFSQKYYRDKELQGVISYGQALGFGVLVGAFAAIILGFFTFIEVKFIDPTIIDQQMELVQQEYLKKGMSEDEVLKMMDMAKKFTGPGVMFFGAILTYTFYAFIISLLTSIIIRKEGSPFNQE